MAEQQKPEGTGTGFSPDDTVNSPGIPAVESRGRFSEARALLVGFPRPTRKFLAAELQQWTMKSGHAETVETAAARISEAAKLGCAYRLALVYAESGTVDLEALAVQLRAGHGRSLSLILCIPRPSFAAWTGSLPAQFSSVIALPVEKSLLYNALHGVLAGEELAAGAISLADYYRLRKGLGKPYRILVADDDEINRRIIARQLELAGHSVRLVTDGEQALDALDDGGPPYHVLILDGNMPVMDGFQATRLIRVMEDARAETPIIMVSADATPKAVQEATDAGVNSFLPKPIDVSTLFETIERLCEKRSDETRGVVVDLRASS